MVADTVGEENNQGTFLKSVDISKLRCCIFDVVEVHEQCLMVLTLSLVSTLCTRAAL